MVFKTAHAAMFQQTRSILLLYFSILFFENPILPTYVFYAKNTYADPPAAAPSLAIM